MKTKTAITRRAALLLAQALGHPLSLIDVTAFGDPEPMVIVTTPRCDYCGCFNPTGHCRACGASVLR